MKKEDLRVAIKTLEPNNVILANPRSNHGELSKELRAVKRRKASRDKDQAIPVTVLYRLEDNERMSWKLVVENGKEHSSELQHGLELPLIGSILPSDEGQPLRVAKHSSGLDISSGDLHIREQFDPRRIYVTANGSKAVFKRLDGDSGKPILWSYKVQSEILLGRNVAMDRTPATAKPTAQQSRRMTQKVLAAYLIGQDPEIVGSDLTKQLQEAFPSARIGSRHGPHYLSLSRNGRLPEVPDSDPREW